MAAAYSRYFDRYGEPVDLKRLSVEMGLETTVLGAGLKQWKDLPLSLAPLLRPGGTVRREIVEDFWPVLQEVK